MNQKAIKTYVVAGIIYELRPLVFGQWQQLTKIINGLEYPEQITPRSVVETFGSRLDELLAVILTEEKKSPADKDLAATAKYLAFNMSPERVAQVVTDFFTITPVGSLMDLVTGVTTTLMMRLQAETGLNSALSCSPPETGPSAAASSGDVRPKRQHPGSKNAAANG